jgi:hypothetical protein
MGLRWTSGWGAGLRCSELECAALMVGPGLGTVGIRTDGLMRWTVLFIFIARMRYR